MTQPVPTEDGLKERLLSMEYSPDQVMSVVGRLLGLQGDLRDAMLDWWNNRQLANPVRGEYSLNSLQERFGLTYLGALLTLDDIDRHPEETLALLKRGLH